MTEKEIVIGKESGKGEEKRKKNAKRRKKRGWKRKDKEGGAVSFIVLIMINQTKWFLKLLFCVEHIR